MCKAALWAWFLRHLEASLCDAREHRWRTYIHARGQQHVFCIASYARKKKHAVLTLSLGMMPLTDQIPAESIEAPRSLAYRTRCAYPAAHLTQFSACAALAWLFGSSNLQRSTPTARW